MESWEPSLAPPSSTVSAHTQRLTHIRTYTCTRAWSWCASVSLSSHGSGATSASGRSKGSAIDVSRRTTSGCASSGSSSCKRNGSPGCGVARWTAAPAKLPYVRAGSLLRPIAGSDHLPHPPQARMGAWSWGGKRVMAVSGCGRSPHGRGQSRRCGRRHCGKLRVAAPRQRDWQWHQPLQRRPQLAHEATLVWWGFRVVFATPTRLLEQNSAGRWGCVLGLCVLEGDWGGGSGAVRMCGVYLPEPGTADTPYRGWAQVGSGDILK
jgi:hypothetical protein